MLVKKHNDKPMAQRVGRPLARPVPLPEEFDERGYRYFVSRWRWHLLFPFLQCVVFLTTDELIIRRYDLFFNFRESTLSRRQFYKIQVRGHFNRYYSLEFYYNNGAGFYHLPYLFKPQEAYAIQQAFMFLQTY